MSYVQLSEGDFQVVSPLDYGRGSPELSTSDSDNAIKQFTYVGSAHAHTNPLAVTVLAHPGST